MKKIFLAALVAASAMTANAQVWIGGEAGYNTSKSTFDGNKLESMNNVTVLPEVGYSLNEKFDVAVAIGFKHGDNSNANNVIDNSNSFVLHPYVRYSYAKVGDLKFFVDGGVIKLQVKKTVAAGTYTVVYTGQSDKTAKAQFIIQK